MLIPGLLSILVAVVLITSLAREARGAVLMPSVGAGSPDVVSALTDSRVTESSGLALSDLGAGARGGSVLVLVGESALVVRALG